MIIDAHHHLWRYNTDEFGWIGEGMQSIARDFSADDLRAVAEPIGVVGSIAVQARQAVGETAMLLAAADESDFIKGVVGWLPPEPMRARAAIADAIQHPKLCGLRYVVQDEPDDAFILNNDFNASVEIAFAVAREHRRRLVYDLLVFERQLEPAIRFVDRHPDGVFVVDHIAKPRIADGEIEPWRTNLLEMGKRRNVACKLSGVATEAVWDSWSLESIRPYLDTALEAFGPERLMFGSDWPVCLLATEYQRWLEVVQEWSSPLAREERDRLFGGTAVETYEIELEAA